MTSRYLTLDDRLQWAQAPQAPQQKTEGPGGANLAAILESCMLRCDKLAEALQETGVGGELFDLLGECVVACGQYMAASSRESFLESQYALICAEVCAVTASRCAKFRCDTSLKCAAACHLCAGKIRSLYQHLPMN